MAAKGTPLVFYVNQNKIVEPSPDPEETLIGYLRRRLHLTGTKLACGEGGCGACTVMISRFHTSSSRIENLAVNACLAPLCSVHGASVTTVEGIGRSGALHPIQERLMACHGSQCGFCTPGMAMTAYALLRNHPEPTERQIDAALQGNLCRCTGYRPILQGLRTFASGCCGNGKSCCRLKLEPRSPEEGLSNRLVETSDFLPYDPSQEPIFPSELQLEAEKFESESLTFQSAFAAWHRPSSLRELLQLKHDHPDAKIINGNTEVGVEVKSKKVIYSCLIHATSVNELLAFKVDDTGISIGAGTTLTTMMERFRKLIDDEEFPEHKKRGLRAYVEMLHWFSGQQIRNVSAIGGNIMTASPISDLNPLLMSSGATLTFASLGGTRTVAMDASFFPGYRRTATKPEEVLLAVRVPFCGPDEFQFGFKQARRREDDIAIVNAGMLVRFRRGDGGDAVEAASISYGGLAPVTRDAAQAAAALIGRRWSDEGLTEAVLARLDAEFPLAADVPGGQAQYRRTLCASFFVRFWHLVGRDLAAAGASDAATAATCDFDESAADRLPLRPSLATQLFELAPPGQLAKDLVGRPIQHVSGDRQTTGEAQYVDDIPASYGEVFVYPVFSRFAAARIVSIDASAALALDPGVLGVLDRRDVPGSNEFGQEVADERVFADGEVRFHGDTVAAVVATNRELAMRASHLVRVEYADVRQPIVTISDAIRAGSFYPESMCRWLRQGDVDAALADRAVHIVEGEVSTEGQEHFYFEPQVSLAVPKDNGEMEMLSSSQNLSLVQSTVAKVLGVPFNRVTARVKRIGGGFGGKEYRALSIATVASVAARKFNRPARCVLDRADDMMTTGTRHPVMIRYRAGVDSDGCIVGLKVDAYLNGGHTIEMSTAVAEFLINNISNAYNIGLADIRCRVCRTDTPSNTAFRGFGAPQAMVAIETVMSHLARAAGMTDREIRETNFIRTGDVSPCGQVYEDVTVQRCWAECLQLSDFANRKAAAEEFNAKQRFRKRGVHITPLCYGMGFGRSFLHQGGALVSVYLDGSVLITHGGVEMGQGLHTKLLQVASRVLDLPMQRLFISETATDKVPNTTTSGASMTTDLNAPAVMNACQRIRDRLLPYMHEDPKAGWDAWVNAAYMDGVSLSANGFYHGPEVHMDAKTMQGRPFNYYSFGAACSEVEIDLLTGDHVIRRSDIVMDIGASLNPAIDIGQIEGAFVQGTGMYTMEEQRFSPTGQLLTKGPGAYKIPGFGDIPEQLNVHLLRGSLCQFPRAVYSSKGIGEPPLCLAASVFMAIRDAVEAARRQGRAGGAGFRFDAPATSERIRVACADDIAVRHAKSAVLPEGAMPWELKLGH